RSARAMGVRLFIPGLVPYGIWIRLLPSGSRQCAVGLGPPADDARLHGIGLGDDFGTRESGSRLLFATAVTFDRCRERGLVVVQRNARRGRFAGVRGGAGVCGAGFASLAFVAAAVHAQLGICSDFLFLCAGENRRNG